MDYEFASVVHPISKSTSCGRDEQCGGTALGAAVQYLGAGDITGRDTSGDLTGNFSSHYAAGTLAFGRALTEKISVGVAGKAIQGKLDDVSAMAYAADFGLMAKPTSRLTLATVVTNVGTKITFLDQADPLPLEAHVSAAYHLHSLMLTSEGIFERDGLYSGRFGVEWRPMSLVALRAGYRTDTLKELSPIAGFSTGVGIDLWGQEFAYAWVPYGDLGNTQYFSLLLRWGEVERQQRNLIYYHSIGGHRTVKDMDPGSPEYEQMIQLINYSDNQLTEIPSVPMAPEQVTSEQNVTEPSASLLPAEPSSFVPKHSMTPMPMEGK